jgi:tRNA uridine 5-carbamoylmethylation protein Kti12
MKLNVKQITQLAEREDKPIFFMTAGLPGSGKSTFLKALKALLPELAIASTDDFIEAEGAKLGLNYSEAFKAISFSHAKTACNKTITEAVKAKKSVVLDQTNCSAKSRRSKMESIPPSFVKICLVFDVSDAVLRERLDRRAAETGKVIPGYVLKNMMNSWQAPSKADGFDHIIEVVQ